LSEIEETRYEPIRYKFQKWLDSCRAAPAADGIPGYITEFELAAQLGVAVATVRRWRRQRYGPQAITIGRRFYYQENAAQTFADAQLKRSEAAAHPPRRGRPRQGGAR
jgi:hypothetical protein